MIASADVTHDANVDVAEREEVAGAVSDVQGPEPDAEGKTVLFEEHGLLVEAHKCMHNTDYVCIGIDSPL